MHYRIRARSTALAVLFSALTIALVACGSDDGGSSSDGGGVAAGGGSTSSVGQTVLDNGRTYSIEEIKAIAGAKTPKQYDVTDLPGAVDAWNALLNQKEYEVRLYASHADAVSMGVSWAESVAGEDALVVGDDVIWDEGSNDRRQCNRSVAHSGCNYTARYGDFIILGNMILLCEGKTSEEALETCEVMTDQLG